MNKYDGNTGRFIRMPEPELPRARHAAHAPLMGAPPTRRPEGRPEGAPAGERPPQRPPERPAGNCRRAGLGTKSPPPGRGGGLGGLISGLPSSLEALLSRLLPDSLETEDLLLMLILYLMYRESGDRELLIIMGAMLFL